ncbi:MAG: glyoxalase [Paracoccaceae bacterium]|nr:glyoxalase [Paracoccaceae bacterium]
MKTRSDLSCQMPPEGENRPNADDFGRALGPGTGFNLLVRDVETAARYQAAVLGAKVNYWDRDFAILRAGSEAGGDLWMLHHDRTYRDHPLSGIAQGADQAGGRGAGAELRLYGRDPDAAEAAARRVEDELGGVVLAGAADKPHGLREAYLIDPEGYCWVPCIPKAMANESG